MADPAGYERFVTPPMTWLHLSAKEWDELLHPRDEAGRFTDAGGGGTSDRATVESRLGYLLAKTGGFSYQVVSRTQPTSGMMVALPGHERIIDHRPTVAEIRQYLKDNADALDEPHEYAGGWLDEETGKVYLDVSVRVDTREEADKLSRDYKQEAYYDISTGESVYTRAREENKAYVLQQGHDGRRDTGSNRQPVQGLTIGQRLAGAIRAKFNPNHDEQGRFAEGDIGGTTLPAGLSPAATEHIQSALRRSAPFGDVSGIKFTLSAFHDPTLPALAETPKGETGKVIQLNSTFFGGDKNPSAEEARVFGKGAFASDAPDSTVTHEIGHILQEESSIKLPVVWPNKEEERIAATVSQNSHWDAGEFVAEVFNGLAHGSTYNSEVMGLYRKYGGAERHGRS